MEAVNSEDGEKITDKLNVSSSMPASTEVCYKVKSLVNPISSMPWLASRSAVPAVLDSLMGPDDAGPFGYCARLLDDVIVHPVLPLFLPL